MATRTRTTKTKAAKAVEPASEEETKPAESSSQFATDAAVNEADAGAGLQESATDTPPSESKAPEAEGGDNPPSAETPGGEAETGNTEGAPAGDGGEASKSAEPPEPDAPAQAATSTSGTVQTGGALPSKEAADSGKASEAVTAAASEPIHQFEAASPVELDGKRYEPGEPIRLSRKLHTELKQARAIKGEWPADD